MIREGEARAATSSGKCRLLATQDWARNFDWKLAAAAARDGKSYEPPAGEADDETAAPAAAIDPAELAAAAAAADWPVPVAKGTALYCHMYRDLKTLCRVSAVQDGAQPPRRARRRLVGGGGRPRAARGCEERVVAVVTITNGAAVKVRDDLDRLGGSGAPKSECYSTLEAALTWAKQEMQRKLKEGSQGKQRATSRYAIDESVSYDHSDVVSGA